MIGLFLEKQADHAIGPFLEKQADHAIGLFSPAGAGSYSKLRICLTT